MEKQQIENMKLIAEFMGIGDAVYENGVVNTLYASSLFYHSSWDSLMPVIDNIGCRGIGAGDEGFDLIEIIWDALTDVSLQGTYDAVVEFIKWYNEN